MKIVLLYFVRGTAQFSFRTLSHKYLGIISDTENVPGATGGGGSEERVTVPLDRKLLNLTLLLKVVQVTRNHCL